MRRTIADKINGKNSTGWNLPFQWLVDEIHVVFFWQFRLNFEEKYYLLTQSGFNVFDATNNCNLIQRTFSGKKLSIQFVALQPVKILVLELETKPTITLINTTERPFPIPWQLIWSLMADFHSLVQREREKQFVLWGQFFRRFSLGGYLLIAINRKWNSICSFWDIRYIKISMFRKRTQNNTFWMHSGETFFLNWDRDGRLPSVIFEESEFEFVFFYSLAQSCFRCIKRSLGQCLWSPSGTRSRWHPW